MLIYKSLYSTTDYYKEQNFICSAWLTESSVLTKDSFKDEMVKVLAQIKECVPKKVLIDTRNFKFNVTQEVQDWIVKFFLERVIELGVTKYAIVVPVDIYKTVSVDHIQTDDKDEEIAIQYFKDIEAAKSWILN